MLILAVFDSGVLVSEVFYIKGVNIEGTVTKSTGIRGANVGDTSSS